QQHDADQREHDDEVDDDQDGLHRCSGGVVWSARRSLRAGRGDRRARAGGRCSGQQPHISLGAYTNRDPAPTR
ncbi:hypothetical protein, partial [Methylobacterium sp. GC_Met_1]|uniref:hypothetical protein n=1 Tax=Methylobacterium sp. GC_Met_1 TaxID=2937377 RepID=UPI00226ADB88